MKAISRALSVAGSYIEVARQSVSPEPFLTTGAPARREVPRHPLYPVTSGTDNFGKPIGTPGGVEVANDGTPSRPTVSIQGEYDWVVIRDGASLRRIESPLTYRQLFDGICEAEREYGLFDIATRDGVHVWELGRQYLVGELARALGLWGPPSSTPLAPNRDFYDGPKRLTHAPRAKRVIYDFHRRGQSDYRIAAFRDDETIVIAQPTPDGYPEVTDSNMVWPIHEYNHWVSTPARRIASARVRDVDPRPFEEALSRTLGIQVRLDTHLRRFLLTYIHELDFWTPVFERICPDEVVLASPLRFGVGAAAVRAGAIASEIQYALTGRYHGTFWYGGNAHHGASRLYAWSDYWARRTNIYKETVIVPNQQPALRAALESDGQGPEQKWDVCVIAQNTVFRRFVAFVGDLVRERPDLRVVVAPHPGAPRAVHEALSWAGLTDHVAVSDEDTLTTIRRSRIALGSYSTSMWEAAALGRPTFVLPVPGYELALEDIESGLFRLAETPGDIEEYVVPDTRHLIFGERA